MAKVLTQAALDALKHTDKRQEIPDAKVAGLYYIVQKKPSVSRSWAYRYRLLGAPAKLTLGRYPALDLPSARNLARRAAVDLVNGVDPRAKKRAAKAEAREPALDLIERVVEAYIERYAKRQTRERSWKETERLLKREVVGQWRGRRLSSIKRPDIHALLDRIVDRAPIVACRVRVVLHHMGEWAVERGLIETNPARGIKPPAIEASRDRVLDDGELLALWAATEATGYPFGPLVRMLLLCSQRLRETAHMQWGEVDFVTKTWSLPAQRSKNGLANHVPLSPQVLAILESLPRFEGSPFVFTLGGARPINDFSKAKHRLDALMLTKLPALPRWTLHDLRRTCASGMAELTVAPHVVEAVLNHRTGVIKGVAAVYNKYNYASEKRAALERWAARIEALASGMAAENVVVFSKAKG
jgi:integrase